MPSVPADLAEIALVAVTLDLLERCRDRILDLKVEGNYESDPTWAREGGFANYRRRWLASEQPEGFLDSLRASLDDSRTVAEVLEWRGDVIGFVWMTFADVAAFGVTIADVCDIALVADLRGHGLGRALLHRLADVARERGAHVLRGDTGAGNDAAGGAARAIGARPIRTIYELILRDPGTTE